MQISILDHGYVEFVEAWGTGNEGVCHDPGGAVGHDYEVGIIEAARQSTQGGFRGWDPAPCTCRDKSLEPDVSMAAVVIDGVYHYPECDSAQNPGDRKLLTYLYRHGHATPFEFAGMVLEIQAPIFVFREWHRHRTQSYNEASARYSPLPNLNYMPSADDVVGRSVLAAETKNKQGQGFGAIVGLPGARQWLADQKMLYDQFEDHYQFGLALGIPKELARIGMPVGRYSKMRAHANLRNWLAFLTLRLDPAAQQEIREYAKAVASIIEKTFPQTYRLFCAQAAHHNP